MIYRAAGPRCALDLTDVSSTLSPKEVRKVLEEAGCVFSKVDVVALARQYVGVSRFTIRPRFDEAPEKVNCSTFTKWIYAQKGIWLPRRAIQQRDVGVRVDEADLMAGDLVFWTGIGNYYRTNPKDGVGHVGIYTDAGTLIHATNARRTNGVYETPFAELAAYRTFRGAIRLVPKGTNLFTVTAPAAWEIESSDDFRWILLNILKKRR